MIPILNPDAGLLPGYAAYLEALRDTGFEGEIQIDYGTRLITATDNSVYQILPQAVAFPKHSEDVQRALGLLATPAFSAIKVSPRGGGTGTNGQSLCDGVVFDLSRHMNRIVELDVAGSGKGRSRKSLGAPSSSASASARTPMKHAAADAKTVHAERCRRSTGRSRFVMIALQ